MKLKIFSDIHEFSSYEIPVKWEYGQDCFYLGDNVDLRGCSMEDVPKAIIRRNRLREAFRGRYVSGNHELETTDLWIKKGKVLLAHGDYIFWRKKHATRYRNKVAGASWLYRIYAKMVYGFFGKFMCAPFPSFFKKKAVRVAKAAGCNIIILGHWHPPKVVDIFYKGVRIVVVPRGKTEVNI